MLLKNNYFPIDEALQPFYKLPDNCTGRQFAVSDIHGFYDTFNELLNKIGFNKDDRLFILGDIIDKGPHGKEMLEMIIDLIDKKYQVFPLRGNHEDMMLASHKKQYDDETLSLPILRRSKGIRDEQRNIYPPYLRLIEKLPYYYELENFYLVHAGFDFTKPNPMKAYLSMLWVSDFKIDNEIIKNKTIIHGHTKNKLSKIVEAVKNKKQIINLDNFTAMPHKEGYGNMVCLNLDSYELTIQPNIEKNKISS